MRRLPLPPPRQVPWTLRPLESAETALSYDRWGRMVLTIRHAPLRGITPAMLDWWFRHIGGEMEIEGQVVNRYLAWHPVDHIRWELARPAPGGGAGQGAVFRIVEAFGGDPRMTVDVKDRVVRLDEGGITLVQERLGVELGRLDHDFGTTPEGASYLSTLTIGAAVPGLSRLLNPLLRRFVFTEAMGRAWLRHNVEEVGALEHILPRLYPS